MTIDKNTFVKEGYFMAKGLFSPHEVAHYRQLLVKHSQLDDEAYGARRNWTQADGVTQNKDFWPLIYNENLLTVLKQLVPTMPMYLQYSDLHVHYDSVGWHKDIHYNPQAVGSDDKKIGALRVAMYFQSYAESHFKMGVVPRSHRHSALLNTLEYKAWSLYRRYTGKLPFCYFTLRPKWFEIEAGDCLIFDTRLLHTGSSIIGPKYSIYLGYGEDGNKLSQRQVEYLHEREDLHYGECPTELISLLQEKNLASQYIVDRVTEQQGA